jgi:hypothetical protein
MARASERASTRNRRRSKLIRQFGSGQKDAEQNMAWQKNGRQKNGVGHHEFPLRSAKNNAAR